MSEFEDVQNLIRLKRHEQPSEAFVEDFLASFHQRQRVEMLNHSARGLLWERVTTYFDGLFAPKLSWAGAMAVAAVGGFVVFNTMNPKVAGLADNKSSAELKLPASKARLEPISDEEVRRYLISRHNEGGLADESERTASIKGITQVEGSLLPAGFKLDIE
ncbi:hypothetical protein BH11VER1_BH11VER1_07970 [soil metagenome]